MTGTNVLVAGNLTFNGWAASGVSATNGSLANALDGTPVTFVTANTNANWNAVAQFANLTAIDSFLVAVEGNLTWYFQTATGGTGVDGDFTTQWTGIGSTSDPIELPIAVSAKWVRLVVAVTGQPKNLYTLETYQGGIAPPSNNDDLEAHLASWLNDTSGDHAHSSPILTQAAITDPDFGLAAIKAGIVDVATDMLKTDSAVLGTIIDAIDANAVTLSTALGPGGAFLTGALRAYLDSLRDTADATLTLTSQATGGPVGLAPDTDPGWVEVDSGAFSGPFTVSVRCDRIYLHITTVGSGVTSYTLESWELGAFAYWWCPTFANQLGRYHTSRAREAVLYEPGMRMDGALVVVPADFEGTWEAARFDG